MKMQLISLLKAINLLSKPNGATKKDLRENLGVSERHVHRIISKLEELEFPIYDEEVPLEKEKKWKIVDTYLKKLPNINIPDTDLTLSEIISLYLLKSEASIYKGTEIETTIDSAFRKIGMLLPKKTEEKLKNLKNIFLPIAKFKKDYSGKVEIIEQLVEAMFDSNTCEVEYQSFRAGKVNTFLIDPLNIFEREGGLYLFVNTTKYGDIRMLAIERIISLRTTENTFEYPKDFNPEKLLESAFDIMFGDPIDFKIWFSASQAPYIKQRTWSKTQKIENQEDGSIIFTMTTSGSWDVKKWILSQGANAEALEPKELRDEIIEELEAARKMYKN
jgi:predicted DNA-binding transcriptional regulator YafY